MILIYSVVIIVILIILAGILIYNSLIRLKTQTEEAWSDIDVQLKRRYDLIPNLIETVKGYQKHESSTFEQITTLRAKAMQAATIAEKAKAEAELSLGLGKLFALAENYPDLKASANFMDLQKNLTDVEEQIQNARRYYNGITRDYNAKIQSFPSNIIAKFFNFNLREFFELENPQEKYVPKVAF